MALLKDCPVRTDWLGVLLLSVIVAILLVVVSASAERCRPLLDLLSSWLIDALNGGVFCSSGVLSTVTPVFLMSCCCC
jgi:hypothetical protein